MRPLMSIASVFSRSAGLRYGLPVPMMATRAIFGGIPTASKVYPAVSTNRSFNSEERERRGQFWGAAGVAGLMTMGLTKSAD